jgi:hypothetical protein
MTKHTTRDEIWNAALALAEQARDADSYRQRRVEVDDVLAEIDADPSRRTVRDCLATMAEMGHLEDSWNQGVYKPAPR